MVLKPFRIGVDARELQFGMGGIARYTRNLVNILVSAYKEVILFTNDILALKDLKCEIKVVQSSRIPFWEDQMKLCQAVREANVDLFISPYCKLPLFLGTKGIVTIHDLTILKNKMEPYWFRLYDLVFSKIYAKRADIIFTTSEYSKNDIVHYINVDGDKVKVVYNIIPDLFIPDNRLNHQKYGLSKDYILYVGNFLPHKNLKTLIKAYAVLTHSIRVKHPLVIVGKTKGKISRKDQGVLALELIELSKELGIKDNIHFVGSVEDNDLPSIYTNAKIFVLPSFFEGFGLPIIEAMACGCPVIASNAASIPEISGEAAILFNPDDYNEIAQKIELVLSNDEVRNRLIMNGLRRANYFRYENIKDVIVKLLDSILYKKTDKKEGLII